MLIEFSVGNFRSFKTRQTFSMVAETPHKELRNVLKSGYSSVPTLLESAAIYGPNGSGKSNLILAMDFFRDFVVDSSKGGQVGEPIGVTPFLFSQNTTSEPSEFEIIFIHQGYLFQYGFTADTTRIYKEWLYATPQAGTRQSPQKWFERDTDDHPKSSFVRKELKGAKKLWKDSTRDNALFLSTAVSLDSEDFKIPFEWIQNKFRCRLRAALSPTFTIREVQDTTEKKIQILEFMKNLDIAFDDFIIREEELSEKDFDNIPDRLKHLAKKDFKKFNITSEYKIGDNTYRLKFDEESLGTRRLFAYAGPILDVLENGYVLVIDELEISLHPTALKGILSLFQNPKTNPNNAQLIFTTHNTTIMNMLDRDQVWLATKSTDTKETELIGLIEFKGNSNEAIEKRYLSGRYGALPNIRDLSDAI